MNNPTKQDQETERLPPLEHALFWIGIAGSVACVLIVWVATITRFSDGLLVIALTATLASVTGWRIAADAYRKTTRRDHRAASKPPGPAEGPDQDA